MGNKIPLLSVFDENGNRIPIPAIKGKDGKDGSDGVSPVITVSKTGKVTTITIKDANETKTATINDGKDSKDGVGIANIVQTTKSTEDGGVNVITVTLTDGTQHTFEVQNGSKGSPGKSPVKGEDYFTPADKESIVSDVLASMPTWVGGSY